MSNSSRPARDNTHQSAARRSESDLVASACKWMDAAMRAWADGDTGRVAVLAPLAVEHLGKAVLWRENPVLLVPLSEGAEATLISLATKPDISDPRLRTIGLGTLLNRLERLIKLFPLDRRRRNRMVDVRNGAMHIGLAADSRHILLDVLTLNDVLLDNLGYDQQSFYGDHLPHVRSLLEQGRSETAHRVAAKLARAQQRTRDLSSQLGDLFGSTVRSLEESGASVISSSPAYSGLAAFPEPCPGCNRNGCLIGPIEEELEADWDVEGLGDGQYHSYIIGEYWVYYFAPQAFYCNVCHFTLDNSEELEEAGLSTDRVAVEVGESSPDYGEPDLQ